MRVGVLTQAAQSVCLVRLQLLARPVISQVKLPHLRYQAQYDMYIHGVLPLFRHCNVEFTLLYEKQYSETAVVLLKTCCGTPVSRRSRAVHLTASSVSRRGSQHVQLLSQGDWDLSVQDYTRYMPSRLQD